MTTSPVEPFALERQPSVSVSGSDVLIRRMRESDVPGIMAIESVSFGAHHWAPDSFVNEMNNHIGRYYVMLHTPVESDDEHENKVIAYFGYWLVLDEVHATTIAVHPAYRGNALGEIALVQIIERAMGHSAHWVTLEVRSMNYGAQNLYYKYGFQCLGLRHKYYQDNREDALIMTTADIASKPYRTLYNDKKEKLLSRIGTFPKGFEI